MLWENRNFVLHHTETEQDKRLLDSLRQQVREEFAKGFKGLPKKDHHYLKPDRKEWTLSQDLETTSRWVKAIDLARKGYSNIRIVVSSTLRRQQKCLEDYFISQSSQPLQVTWTSPQNSTQSENTTSVNDETPSSAAAQQADSVAEVLNSSANISRGVYQAFNDAASLEESSDNTKSNVSSVGFHTHASCPSLPSAPTPHLGNGQTAGLPPIKILIPQDVFSSSSNESEELSSSASTDETSRNSQLSGRLCLVLLVQQSGTTLTPSVPP